MAHQGAPGAASERAARFDVSAFLFNAAGRSGRTAYLAGSFIAALLMRAPLLANDGWPRLALAWLTWFPAFVIWGVVTARRLHDLGLAGWWFALLAALFLIAGAHLDAPRDVLGWVAAGPGLVLAAGLLILPGQDRFNRFGPRPG